MMIPIRATYSRSTSRRQKNFEPQMIDAVYAEVPDGLVREKICETLVYNAPQPMREGLMIGMEKLREQGMFDYEK